MTGTIPSEEFKRVRDALEPFALFFDRVDNPQFRPDATLVAAEGDIALTVGTFKAAFEAYRRTAYLTRSSAVAAETMTASAKVHGHAKSSDRMERDQMVAFIGKQNDDGTVTFPDSEVKRMYAEIARMRRALDLFAAQSSWREEELSEGYEFRWVLGWSPVDQARYGLGLMKPLGLAEGTMTAPPVPETSGDPT